MHDALSCVFNIGFQLKRTLKFISTWLEGEEEEEEEDINCVL